MQAALERRDLGTVWEVRAVRVNHTGLGRALSGRW